MRSSLVTSVGPGFLQGPSSNPSLTVNPRRRPSSLKSTSSRASGQRRRTVSFSDPLTTVLGPTPASEAAHLPLASRVSTAEAMAPAAANYSARSTPESSMDGLTLKLPAHGIDENDNFYQRWQLRQGSTQSTVSSSVPSAGLLGLPPTRAESSASNAFNPYGLPSPGASSARTSPLPSVDSQAHAAAVAQAQQMRASLLSGGGGLSMDESARSPAGSAGGISSERGDSFVSWANNATSPPHPPSLSLPSMPHSQASSVTGLQPHAPRSRSPSPPPPAFTLTSGPVTPSLAPATPLGGASVASAGLSRFMSEAGGTSAHSGATTPTKSSPAGTAMHGGANGARTEGGAVVHVLKQHHHHHQVAEHQQLQYNAQHVQQYTHQVMQRNQQYGVVNHKAAASNRTSAVAALSMGGNWEVDNVPDNDHMGDHAGAGSMGDLAPAEHPSFQPATPQLGLPLPGAGDMPGRGAGSARPTASTTGIPVGRSSRSSSRLLRAANLGLASLGRGASTATTSRAGAGLKRRETPWSHMQAHADHAGADHEEVSEYEEYDGEEDAFSTSNTVPALQASGVPAGTAGSGTGRSRARSAYHPPLGVSGGIVLGGGGTLTPAKLKGALGHLARSPAPSVTTPPVRVTNHIGSVTSVAAGGMAAASSHGGATLAHNSGSAAEFPTPAARAASAHTFGGSVSAGGAAGRLSDDGVTRSPAHERESEDPAALLDASGALEADIAALMKRLPASSRYGAREGGGGLLATELVQGLYARVSRLQGLLRRREVDAREAHKRVAALQAELESVQGSHAKQYSSMMATQASLDSELLEAARRLAARDQQLLEAQRLARDASRRALAAEAAAAGNGAAGGAHGPVSEGGLGAAQHTATIFRLQAALQEATSALAARDEELTVAHARLAERDAELAEAGRVLRASERDLAVQLRTAGSKLLQSLGGGDSAAAGKGSVGSSIGVPAGNAAEAARIRELEEEVLSLRASLASAVQARSTPAHSSTSGHPQQYNGADNMAATLSTAFEESAISQRMSAASALTAVTASAGGSEAFVSQAYGARSEGGALAGRRPSVAAALASELSALRSQLEAQQAAVEGMRAEAAAAVQEAEVERATRARLQSAAERLRVDAARARGEAERLAAELEAARTSTPPAMISQAGSRRGSASNILAASVSAAGPALLLGAGTTSALHLDDPSALPQSTRPSITELVLEVGTTNLSGSFATRQIDDLKKALAKERSDRQLLVGQLEVARAELAALRTSQNRAGAVRAAEVQEASARAAQVESQLADAKRRLAAAETRLSEAADEARARRGAQVDMDAELASERDAARKLKLMVATLQGHAEVLQKQLAGVRADLAAARQQQLADALASQALSRQIEELGLDAQARLRAAEDAADALARAHLDRLMELRAHRYLMGDSCLAFASAGATAALILGDAGSTTSGGSVTGSSNLGVRTPPRSPRVSGSHMLSHHAGPSPLGDSMGGHSDVHTSTAAVAARLATPPTSGGSSAIDVALPTPPPANDPHSASPALPPHLVPDLSGAADGSDMHNCPNSFTPGSNRVSTNGGAAVPASPPLSPRISNSSQLSRMTAAAAMVSGAPPASTLIAAAGAAMDSDIQWHAGLSVLERGLPSGGGASSVLSTPATSAVGAALIPHPAAVVAGLTSPDGRSTFESDLPLTANMAARTTSEPSLSGHTFTSGYPGTSTAGGSPMTSYGGAYSEGPNHPSAIVPVDRHQHYNRQAGGSTTPSRSASPAPALHAEEGVRSGRGSPRGSFAFSSGGGAPPQAAAFPVVPAPTTPLAHKAAHMSDSPAAKGGVSYGTPAWSEGGGLAARTESMLAGRFVDGVAPEGVTMSSGGRLQTVAAKSAGGYHSMGVAAHAPHWDQHGTDLVHGGYDLPHGRGTREASGQYDDDREGPMQYEDAAYFADDGMMHDDGIHGISHLSHHEGHQVTLPPMIGVDEEGWVEDADSQYDE